MLKNLKEFENKPPQYWEFMFLSGFHGKSPDAFYRIKIEKTMRPAMPARTWITDTFKKAKR